MDNSRMGNWRRAIAELPWTAQHAQHSANLALAKAQWLGLDKDQAIQHVFNLAPGGFFRKNPHLLLQAWQTSAEEIACPDRCQDAVMGFESVAA